MAIAPADGQDFAKAIKDVYEYTEQIILQKIAKRVASGGPAEDPEHWLERKLAEVRRHEAEMDRIIRQLAKAGPQAINDLVVQAYLSGIISADSDLVGAGIAVPLEPLAITPAMMADPMNVVATFGATHTAALASITAEAMGGLQGAHVMMLRQARDGYRDVITDVARGAIAGVDTRLQATQKAISKFADQGIGVFKDKNGKQWDIAVYAEMATRTAMAHAHVQGHINRMVQQGRDLVIVSHHSEPSDLCAPHEGKVYSISGNDKRYKALSWAIADGLFHPNCRHTINAYIEGLTEVPKIKADPEGYKKRQKQRYMETQVRRWKRRQATAVHPTEIAKSEAKVKEWQKALREYTKEHDLGRKYSREKVYTRTLGKGEDTGGVRVPPTKPTAAVRTLGDLVKTAKKETMKESKSVVGGSGAPDESLVPMVRAGGVDFSRIKSVAAVRDMESFNNLSALIGLDGSGTGSDGVMVDIAKRQGFTEKPSVVDASGFGDILSNGGIEVFRGVTDEGLAKQFYDGDYFGGKGAYGSGYYFATASDRLRGSNGESVALGYANGNRDAVVRAAIRSGARIIEMDDAVNAQREDIRKLDAEMMSSWGDSERMYRLQAEKLVIQDIGRWAASRGYDALHTNNFDDYYVVFNRTVMVVVR